MGYFRMLVFYFLEFLGSSINFLGSIIHYYPSLELGVNYLLLAQGRKVHKEKEASAGNRRKKEEEASLIEAEAHKIETNGTNL